MGGWLHESSGGFAHVGDLTVLFYEKIENGCVYIYLYGIKERKCNGKCKEYIYLVNNEKLLSQKVL